MQQQQQQQPQDNHQGSATSSATEEAEDIRFWRELQQEAVDFRRQYRESARKGNRDAELLNQAEKAAQEAEKFRILCQETYPESIVFHKLDKKGSELNIEKMPHLLGAIEQPVGAHGGVYRNVKLFFAHVERYALSQGVNLDLEHRKCMPSILGKNFREHYELQMKRASAQGLVPNWETVKLWLSEYVDTPLERARSVKALFRIVPKKDENNRQFAERWLEATSLVDFKRLSVDEYSFIVQCSLFPSEWRSKIHHAISTGSEDIMGKEIRDMIMWFHDLELPAANKRSAEDAPAERATKNSRQTEAPNGTEASKWAKFVYDNARSNRICNRCGSLYKPGHNKTCSKQGHRRNEGEASTPLVNRMANMQVAEGPSPSQNIDRALEAADILTEDMEDCQYDKIE